MLHHDPEVCIVSQMLRTCRNSIELGPIHPLFPTAHLDDLSRSRRGPADKRSRAPASLSPGNAALSIFSAVVTHLGRARKERSVVERIDIDHAPHPIIVSQNHGDVDAASTADDLMGSFETERVSLKQLRSDRGQCYMRRGIRESPRIVLATERALACTKHLVAWPPVGCELDANRSTVTLTLEEHALVHSPGFEPEFASFPVGTLEAGYMTAPVSFREKGQIIFPCTAATVHT
jgi:hypothetical protein